MLSNRYQKPIQLFLHGQEQQAQESEQLPQQELAEAAEPAEPAVVEPAPVVEVATPDRIVTTEWVSNSPITT